MGKFVGQRYESLGNYKSHFLDQSMLCIEAINAKVFIQNYDNSIFRITVSKGGGLPPFSYAVIKNPLKTNFTIKEDKEKLILNRDKIRLVFQKNPLRISITTLKGKVINADDENLGCGWMGDEVSCYKKLNPNERFVGLGEKTGPFDKRGKSYTNWNSDVFGYSTEADPLYATLPFYIGINEGLYYGIFFDNTFKSTFNFGASNNRFVSLKAAGGYLDYYFIAGENIAQIIQSYATLTGTMQLPPKWSIGLQQCRYSYYPAHELLSIAKNYRDREIPCDVIYYDIHYMDKYKVFTWDEERFPDPVQTNQNLHDMNFKTVCIIDPGVKVEKGYHVYEDGLKNDAFIKYPDGENYQADVWPGWCHFPDFTNEKTRQWWSTYFTQLSTEGIDGFWNDMNEIASWGQDTPDIVEFDFEDLGASHKAAHNVYGMQMARATRQGAINANPKERPFILTRAAYAGIQRYAALWTGDNTATDEHLLLGARMVTNLGLVGIPFCGYDVGGFLGDTSPYLFARWIQMAAFAPFFRIHKMVNSKDSEPWSYGEEVEAIAKNFIELRYRLMPYLYSLFFEASQSGMPVCRTLMIDHPDDENVYKPDFENQFLLGESLLICPQKSTTTISKVYLPKGDWYLLYNDQKFKGGQVHLLETPIEILPVFARASSCFTEQSITQYWNDKHDGILRIHHYKGKKDYQFLHYEDDGISLKHEKNHFLKRNISFNHKKNTLNISEAVGKFKSKYHTVRIYLHGFPKNETQHTFRFIEPLPNFDPFYTPIDFIYECKGLNFIEQKLHRNGEALEILLK